MDAPSRDKPPQIILESYGMTSDVIKKKHMIGEEEAVLLWIVPISTGRT